MDDGRRTATPETWALWRTLDAIYPTPISRTRDRICRWVHDAVDLGLITPAEGNRLKLADWFDRNQKGGE